MKSIGTEGSLPIHETYPHFSICDAEGWQSLATTYWASLQGQRSGARQDELSYFVECIRSESPPAVITAGDYGRGVTGRRTGLPGSRGVSREGLHPSNGPECGRAKSRC